MPIRKVMVCTTAVGWLVGWLVKPRTKTETRVKMPTAVGGNPTGVGASERADERRGGGGGAEDEGKRVGKEEDPPVCV